MVAGAAVVVAEEAVVAEDAVVAEEVAVAEVPEEEEEHSPSVMIFFIQGRKPCTLA